MKRALIVKLGAIGDVVMALPAAYRLMNEGYAIDWLAGAAAASVLRCFPELRVIETDERLLLRGTAAERLQTLRTAWKQIGTTRYDAVATLYYDRRYRLLTLPVRGGAQHMHLVRGDRQLELLPGRHHTDEFARVMLQALRGNADMGPEPLSLSPVFPTRLPDAPLPAGSRTRITLAPGGARNLLRDDVLRRWPLDHYVQLAAALLQKGYEVVLTGGPEDGWVRESFARLDCTDLIGALTLPQLLAMFHASDAVVTHDSGPLHLAGCVGCALLGIFGPVDPRGRLPRRNGAMALWGGEGFACRPCYDGSGYADCHDNLCMAQVTPAMAMDAVLELLADRDAGLPKPAEVRLPRATLNFVPAAQLAEAY